jgi:sporulation protein YlmC with PRC-barrel domain
VTAAPAFPTTSSRHLETASIDGGQRAHDVLERTPGYLVVDTKGRIVGRVNDIVYAGSPRTPSALCIRSGFFSRRRGLVPIQAIEAIDDTTRVIALQAPRQALALMPEG